MSLFNWYDKFRKKTFPSSINDSLWLHSQIIEKIHQSQTILMNLILIQGDASKSISDQLDQSLNDPYISADRMSRLLFGISKEMSVLEIGPAQNPVAAKRDGWKTSVIDYASRDELLKLLKQHYMYADMPNLERTEEVDYIWKGGQLDEAIPKNLHGSFDACVSSHNLEHIPDFVSFFKAMSKLLKTSGLISIALPDKRHCFDWFRPLSTTGQIIEAYLQGRQKHTLANILDTSLYHCYTTDISGFGQHPLQKLHLSNLIPLNEIIPSAQEKLKDTYYDAHGWIFTPASFSLIIYELGALNLIDFEIDKISPAAGNEFTAILKRRSERATSDEQTTNRRLKLMRRVVEELGAQADYQRAGAIIDEKHSKALKLG